MDLSKLTMKSQAALEGAREQAVARNHQTIEPEHVLFALLSDPEGVVYPLLPRLDISPRPLGGAVLTALAEVRGRQRVTDPNPEEKYQALERYGRDLTELARRGKLDPVIGRDDEIRRVIQVLSRRTKNNPVLIGESGVGKT